MAMKILHPKELSSVRISTGTSSSHMLLLNAHTVDKDADLVGLFLEVSWRPPEPLLTYNHVCCSPQVTQTRTLSPTLTYGHCGKLLHGDARTGGSM